MSQPVFIITGEQGAGKTTCLSAVADILQRRNIPVSGFVAEGEWQDGRRTAFHIRDIGSGKSHALCTNKPAPGLINFGRFWFDPATIDKGNSIIAGAPEGSLIVIDEIGKFEVEGNVWSDSLNAVASSGTNPLLITVRKGMVDNVSARFNLTGPILFDRLSDPGYIANTIEGYFIK